MSDLQERIKSLNAKVKELNSIRQKNIGRREALLKQQEDGITMYNQKYGTSITAETIKEEYARVSEEKTKEADLLESIINAIGSGDYDTANKLAGVEIAPQPQVSASANDAYVDKVTEAVLGTNENQVVSNATATSTGTAEQTHVAEEPVMPTGNASELASQAQSLASTFAETGTMGGIKGATPVEDKGDGTIPFAPSPLSNKLNVETGEVKNMPDSVFNQTFKKEEDEQIPTPVAPPLGAFGVGGKGTMPSKPIAPLGSLM